MQALDGTIGAGITTGMVMAGTVMVGEIMAILIMDPITTIALIHTTVAEEVRLHLTLTL
jgi:hypothetical protein